MNNDPFEPLGGARRDAGADRAKSHRGVVLPVPPNMAAKAPKSHPKLGRPSSSWTYRDQDGEVLGFVCRFDQKGEGKSFRPLCLFRQGEAVSWWWEAWPVPRPLYGLDRLAKSPDAPVLIAEGEKSAEAAQRLLPGFVCITSPSGSKSAAKADWSPLADRKVFLWPDADEPGHSYVETVCGLLRKAGASSLAILTPPDNVCKGWDAGDALQEGWTQEQAQKLIQSARAVPFSRKAARRSSSGASEGPAADDETGKKRKTPRQRDLLLEALDGAELWHSPEKVAYASITVNGHLEHWRVESAAFQRWAAGQYYRATGGAPAGQMLTDALRVLCVRAIEDGHCHRPMTRTGSVDEACWLDLCDDAWRAVKITALGWEVIDVPPVKFVRSETMSALPEPEAGYMLEELRSFINAEDSDYQLIVAWLVAALWGRASTFPVLALGGEQGSGKTTMARMLRTIVDPSAVPALALPKDERDLFVMARSGHMLSFDNVSKVDAWFSDAVCRLATGSGFVTRKLHSDGNAFWFQGARPVLLNGIPSLTDRADLAERALTVRLLRIDERTRQSEDEFWQAWSQTLPHILGALLDALSSAIRHYGEVKLDRMPRMADFARLMAAAEPRLGWEAGEFMAAYDANRNATTEGVFEADPVAVAISHFIATKHPTDGWQGTATALLADLNRIVSEDVRLSRFWPSKVNALGNAVERAAPLLRYKGILLTKRNTGTQRLITLTVA